MHEAISEHVVEHAQCLGSLYEMSGNHTVFDRIDRCGWTVTAAGQQWQDRRDHYDPSWHGASLRRVDAGAPRCSDGLVVGAGVLHGRLLRRRDLGELHKATVSGVIGAAVVAVWFFLIDFGLGRPFFTPAALGSALFRGVTEVGQVSVDFATVAGYSVFHVGAFVLVGALASAIVTVAEKRPPLVLGAVLLFVVFEALFMGYLAMGVEFLLGALQWWAVAIGNLLAAVAMGYYLWAQHPKLREAMAADPFDHTD